MTSLEATRITSHNREIINFASKSHPLSEAQLTQLENFSVLDNEWRMLMAIGDRYSGTDERMRVINAQRNEQIDSNLDPTLAGAICEYLRLVEIAVFENEP